MRDSVRRPVRLVLEVQGDDGRWALASCQPPPDLYHDLRGLMAHGRGGLPEDVSEEVQSLLDPGKGSVGWLELEEALELPWESSQPRSAFLPLREYARLTQAGWTVPAEFFLGLPHGVRHPDDILSQEEAQQYLVDASGDPRVDVLQKKSKKRAPRAVCTKAAAARRLVMYHWSESLRDRAPWFYTHALPWLRRAREGAERPVRVLLWVDSEEGGQDE